MRDFKLIFFKEIKDILRDKRSFVMMFVPVLLFPLMFTLMGSQMNAKNTKENIPCIVEFMNPETAGSDRTLYYSLCTERPDLIAEKEAQDGRSAEDELAKGSVYLILRFNNGKITTVYDDANSKSATAFKALSEKLGELLNEYYDSILQIRPKDGTGSAPVPPFSIDPITLSAITHKTSNSVLASIAPMILVALITSGGISVAVDLFTGEKERGTMESLMTTQASRMSILAAKFTATLCVSLTSMLMSVLAYVISLRLSPNTLALMTGMESFIGQDNTSDIFQNLGLGAGHFLCLAAVCIALSVFAVSFMTLIGLHAKTVKEAQSQMTLLTLIPTLLGGMTVFMDTLTMPHAVMLLPIFNALVSIKMIFMNAIQDNLTHILVAVGSLLLYSALMGFLSVRMLKSEKLLRG